MSAPGPHPPVLVVGAGPTGLAAACTLLQNGVPCRVVERRAGVAEEPKALILWSGALEVLRRLGVSQEVVDRSLPLESASYFSRGRRIGGVRFGGLGDTAFPGPICLPQPGTEQALYDRLLALGGSVEWSTRVHTAEPTEDGEGVRVVLGPDGDAHTREEVVVPWVVAADGSRSVVREALGVPFEGDTYDRVFLLADGVVSGPTPVREAQYHLTPDGVLVVVPLPGGGHRVFFDIAPDGETAPPDDALIARLLAERGPRGLRVDTVWWRSRFRVHARVAREFRRGRVLIAGDAAHLHSPAGGQGLNTGIQDGFDLAWKLAAVLRGAPETLLDSYPLERRPIARTVVRSADRQTRTWMARSPLARLVRDTLMRVLSASGLLEKRLVPQLAQISPDLTESPAVVAPPAGWRARDAVGGALPGRRIGDAPLSPLQGTDATSLHAYLASGRHALVVGGGSSRAREAAAELRGRLPEDVDVLLLAPSAVEAVGDHDVALLSGRGGEGAEWVIHVRPDAVVASVAPLDARWRPGVFLGATLLPDAERSLK
ncbi:FAD-dependent monooxygenase [Nocardiopsis lambiniae]|uniref:FAD-dependent monooxygenase n=1 Tax=Nocardiopsis lambiniae TaxID=3075539 RepID=A0ABU2MA84_9ACTN|nr:FAD-dependent monooxygenase [Nocardiopsis sp. DSM 44743]MDT0329573.1 FAD-dependent monooxygenase [Nocardiopsis sp. DSM 44743]